MSAQGFAQCRTFGHAWTEGTSSAWRVTPGEIGWHLRCERCGSERLDRIDTKTGEMLRRKYVYAQGYQLEMSEGVERPTRSDWRLVTIKLGKTHDNGKARERFEWGRKS